MPRKGVQYLGGDEPDFIRKFKQRIGHKEGPDIDTKRRIPNPDDEDDYSDDGMEKEDEKPVVVVIKRGDLTAEEVKTVEKEKEEGPARLDEKITFKKPIKRSNTDTKDEEEEQATDSSANSTKKKKESSKKSSSAKKIKNSSLLSFGDEEEEEDF